MKKDYLIYLLIRAIVLPISFMPYRMVHCLGKIIGRIAYFFMTEYRKIALSNLACAKDLKLNNEQIIKYAKQSFQNLAITCLEYAKFDREKDFSKIVQPKDFEYAYKLQEQGQGIIFFCAHLSNWEVSFLFGNLKMNGIAVGKPIKNRYLYQWIVRIREKTNGTIVSTKNALKEGIRALRKGKFIGIVGDQGMPESGYVFPFLGRDAFNSTAPALLAYKTNCPIIVVSTTRKKGKYEVAHSKPIWPDLNNPLEKEIKQMMNKALHMLEEKIKESPGEWLWQHNRWKQQTPQVIYKPYRFDCILLVIDHIFDPFCFSIFRKIYEKEYVAVILPKKIDSKPYFLANEILTYSRDEEIFKDDYRFKVIFNFTTSKKIEKYYLKKSAITVVSFKNFFKLTKAEKEKMIINTLCRPNTFEKVHAT